MAWQGAPHDTPPALLLGLPVRVNRFYVVYAGRKLTRRSRLRPIQGTDNARIAQEKVNLPKSVFWIWHRWMTAVQHWDEPNLG